MISTPDRDLRRELDELHERMISIKRALGDRSALEPLPEAAFDFLVCRVGEDRTSFMIETIDEVVPMAMLSAIAEADHWVLGLLDLGGELIPVIDVLARVSGAPRRPTLSDIILISSTREGRFGLVVQEVIEVRRASPAQLQSTGSQIPRASYVVGVLADSGATSTLMSINKLVSLSYDNEGPGGQTKAR